MASAGSNSKRNPLLIEDFGNSSVTKGDADLRNTQHGMRTGGIMSCPWYGTIRKWESPENASGIIIQYQYPISVIPWELVPPHHRHPGFPCCDTHHPTVIPVSLIDAGDVGIPGSTNPQRLSILHGFRYFMRLVPRPIKTGMTCSVGIWSASLAGERNPGPHPYKSR